MSEKQVEQSAATHCYAVVVFRETVCSSGKTVVSRKTITLPFVPFVGLDIESIDGTGEECKVTNVRWQVDRERFQVYTQPNMFPHLSEAECQAEEVEYGWEIEDIRQGITT
jgi:hypothetical protein